MKCAHCGLQLLGGGECSHAINAPLEIFLAQLALMTPEQREATMRELEDRACLFCGVADPECPCWLEDEEAEVVS